MTLPEPKKYEPEPDENEPSGEKCPFCPNEMTKGELRAGGFCTKCYIKSYEEAYRENQEAYRENQ